jgi:hypothetical protein
MSLRKQIRPAIAAAIAQGTSRGLAGRDLEHFVRANSWLWGPRAMWPYRVWCDEIRIQLGIKLPRPSTRPDPGLPLFDEPGDPS